MGDVWEPKVVGYGEVPPDQLLANPQNWRRHPGSQRDALRGSLDELGIIRSVLVNRTTGHLLDGHARVEEYLSNGVELVPVEYVEIPAELESLALLVLDPIAKMAQADKDALDAVLRDANTTNESLQQLFSDLADEAGLYGGGSGGGDGEGGGGGTGSDEVVSIGVIGGGSRVIEGQLWRVVAELPDGHVEIALVPQEP